MTSLARELERTHDPRQCDFLTPGNCQSVHLHFRGDKVAKVVGSLAHAPPQQGASLSGLLIKKDFKCAHARPARLLNTRARALARTRAHAQPPGQGALTNSCGPWPCRYKLLAASDLPDATPLRATTLVQRPSFRYTGSLDALLSAVGTIFAVAPLPASAVDVPAAKHAALTPASEATDDGVTYWRVHDELRMVHSAAAASVGGLAHPSSLLPASCFPTWCFPLPPPYQVLPPPSLLPTFYCFLLSTARGGSRLLPARRCVPPTFDFPAPR